MSAQALGAQTRYTVNNFGLYEPLDFMVDSGFIVLMLIKYLGEISGDLVIYSKLF